MHPGNEQARGLKCPAYSRLEMVLYDARLLWKLRDKNKCGSPSVSRRTRRLVFVVCSCYARGRARVEKGDIVLDLIF